MPRLPVTMAGARADRGAAGGRGDGGGGGQQEGNGSSGVRSEQDKMIDAHIGRRVRLRRTLMGMSRAALGAAMGRSKLSG